MLDFKNIPHTADILLRVPREIELNGGLFKSFGRVSFNPQLGTTDVEIGFEVPVEKHNMLAFTPPKLHDIALLGRSEKGLFAEGRTDFVVLSTNHSGREIAGSFRDDGTGGNRLVFQWSVPSPGKEIFWKLDDLRLVGFFQHRGEVVSVATGNLG